MLIKGTRRSDQLGGRDSADRIFGEGGDDFLYGDGGDDLIKGGAGNDRIVTGEGANIASGGRGHDTLLCSASDPSSFNFLRGDRGDDILLAGENGFTRMEGGPGNDSLSMYAGSHSPEQVYAPIADAIGGRGADEFGLFSYLDGQVSQMRVLDFVPGEDHLVLLAFTPERTIVPLEIFQGLDTDGNGTLDGNDPNSGAFKSEHGIDMWVGDDLISVQNVAALYASDFVLA